MCDKLLLWSTQLSQSDQDRVTKAQLEKANELQTELISFKGQVTAYQTKVNEMGMMTFFNYDVDVLKQQKDNQLLEMETIKNQVTSQFEYLQK